MSDYDYQVWLEPIPGGKVEAKMVSPGGWTEADIGQHLIRGRLESPVESKHKGYKVEYHVTNKIPAKVDGEHNI